MSAHVAEWQTRTAQDRMGKPVEVRLLSRALFLFGDQRCVAGRYFSVLFRKQFGLQAFKDPVFVNL